MGPLAKWHEAICRDFSNFPCNLPFDQPLRLFGYACCRDVKRVRYPGELDLVVMPRLSWLATSVVWSFQSLGSDPSETLSLQRALPLSIFKAFDLQEVLPVDLGELSIYSCMAIGELGLWVDIDANVFKPAPFRVSCSTCRACPATSQHQNRTMVVLCQY
ncbi:hypothetical protein PMIT1306_01286 [Prochlorococcus sp. MIT 1306]|nr:hypothetical protein PMIT1306_01286 [Prochlorococcus sp. MIT 1306]